jgi:hypothetical protein
MTQTKDSSQPTEFTPIEFLDDMKDDKHIILFDENPAYSKKIQFHFLEKGLERGEQGVYAMPENEKVIEKEMSNHGIDVEKYKKEGILNIHQTAKTHQYPQGDHFENLMSRIFSSNLAKPYRIVGMLDFDMNTKKGMDSFLKAEAKSHSIFERFKGSWMCPYPIAHIQPENRLIWVKELIKNHDSVIFTSSQDNGIAFDIVH